MVCFICNICGASSEVEHFASEPATCACGSNVRLRASIHLLSIELGALEIRDDLVFHGGSGATLEMREFGGGALRTQLLAAGFRAVDFLTENVPASGILFDHDTSQPLIARNQDFTLDHWAGHQMVDAWQSSEAKARQEKERADVLAERIRLASGSRWVRLARKFGAGPKFE